MRTLTLIACFVACTSSLHAQNDRIGTMQSALAASALDLANDCSEGPVACGGAARLDEDLLDLMLRERVIDRARGASGLADPALGDGLGLRPDCAADHERDERERQPPPDGFFAMLCAPAPGAGG